MTKQVEANVRLDLSPLWGLLTEVEALLCQSPKLLESLPGFFNEFIDGSGDVQLICFEQKPAVGALDIVIVVKPSDKFLELLRTLRARQCKLLAPDAE